MFTSRCGRTRNILTQRVFIAGILAISTSAFAQTAPPIHYYDAAIGKTGTQLKAALQGIIRSHTVIPYTSSSTDTWDAIKILDQDPTNTNNILLIYSGWSVPKSEQSNGSTGTWDREHLWPQSFGIVALNSNSRAKSDLFNIRPIDIGVNSSRGNKYYDVSTSPVSSYPEAPGSTYDSNSWEPRTADKGGIARSMFYMATRYDGSDADVPDLELSDSPDQDLYRFGKLSTLLAWHRQYPVATSERQRNQTIYATYQHNRNPFVDHPDYVEMVFLGVTPNQAWKDTSFTDSELANPVIGGDNADPDGDDVSNLFEYIFNRDPWQPDQSADITADVTRQGITTNLFVIFPHNRNATDASLTYEWSTDLQTWTTAPAQLISTTITSSETEELNVRVSSSVPTVFVRIRGTKND